MASVLALVSVAPVLSAETASTVPTSTRLYANVYAGALVETSAADIAPTADGGYVVAGVTSNPVGYPVGWILKLDSAGRPRWSEEVGGPFTYPTAIDATADGGVVVAGGTQGGSGAVCDLWSGLECAFVIKLDALGALQWKKVYGTGDSGLQVAWEVRQTPDGGYVVAGNSGHQTEYGAWIAKLDPAGDVVWQKVFGGTSQYDLSVFESVEPTANGGYVATGWTTVGYDSQGIAQLALLVVKLDAAGTVLWQREYSNFDGAENNIGGARADAIVQAPDGGYLVGASWTNPAPPVGADFLLLKLDAGGNIQWQRAYDGGVGCFTGGTGSIVCVRLGGVIYAARATPDGGYLLSGIGHAVMGDWVAVMAWMGKVDAGGTFLWQNTYFPSSSSAYAFYDAAPTADGGVVAISTTTDYATGRDHIYVVKADGNGTVAGCGDVHAGVSLTLYNPALAAGDPFLPVSAAPGSSAAAAGDVVQTSAKVTPVCGEPAPITEPAPRKPKKPKG